MTRREHSQSILIFTKALEYVLLVCESFFISQEDAAFRLLNLPKATNILLINAITQRDHFICFI